VEGLEVGLGHGGAWASRYGLHGLAEYNPCQCFFLFFSPFLALYYWTIFSIFIFLYFLFLYITKALPRLTPYRLKDKKGVYRLETPCRLKNYDRNINSEENTTKEMTLLVWRSVP
jgi:hypothetical protein